MPSDLIQVANFATESEAGYVCSILKANGIDAFVDGGAASTVLSHVGTALGGVRLLTSSEDVEAATQILDSLREPNADDEPWFCRECNETVEAGFDICWGCGKERGIVEGDVPVIARGDLPASPPPTAVARSKGDSSNPYVAPGIVDAVTPPLPSPTATDADDLVLRAYRGAFIGFVMVPVLTHAYSTYLLIRVAALPGELKPETEKLWYRAFAINAFAMFLWIAIIAVFFRT